MQTNEQSLIEDYAQNVFEAERIDPVSLAWVSARVLVITVDPAQWAQAARGLSLIQSRAADAGFKVRMRGAGPQT